MQIAITGATGFLGRYIVRQLASAGNRLRCWFRPQSDRGGLEAMAESIEWLPGELSDPVSARQLVRGMDALVHAAVEWKGPRNRGRSTHGDGSLFFKSNLIGSLELFEAAKE